jgi:hypothetical protein
MSGYHGIERPNRHAAHLQISPYFSIVFSRRRIEVRYFDGSKEQVQCSVIPRWIAALIGAIPQFRQSNRRNSQRTDWILLESAQ